MQNVNPSQIRTHVLTDEIGSFTQTFSSFLYYILNELEGKKDTKDLLLLKCSNWLVLHVDLKNNAMVLLFSLDSSPRSTH